ncbi:Spc19-domain-containing protein [Leucosporidium creatinivorum]|uniref:DASH complex subunit SPC19 n=1 Tax=Leucosporidium creatinivorum TaxID=106004 RepID=A0A1Y2FVI8_9BASI|nr:Spc19-domain-containing protein [Leucosporidium creatinivorum]
MSLGRARQSVYPAPPAPSYWNTLDACSQSLHSTCSSLNSAIVTLDQGTYDFPRLAQVISSRRAFDTITETEVLSAQRSLASEMGPQITELIERAEGGLEGMKKKEKLLRAKLEKRLAPPTTRTTAAPPDLDALERKLKQLQGRKDMLGRAVEKLDIEQQQMAAKGRGRVVR